MAGKPLNIGIFTDTYLPDTNGVVTSLLLFRKELEKNGYKVFVFAPGHDFRFHYSDKERVWRFPALGSLGNVITIALPVVSIKEFKRFHLDIVHTYAPGPMGFLGVHVGRRLNVPIIHTFHTFLEEYTHYLHLPTAGAKALVRWIMKNFLRKHDHIIVPSSAIKQRVASYKINKPISLIPTGIDRKEIQLFSRKITSLPLKQYHIQPGDQLLVSVGRLGKEKNFGFLLEVMKYLDKRNHHIKLLLIGDGPERKSLEQQANIMGISNNVIFTGIIPYEEIFMILRVAKIFVFASLTETQGLVTLEAMAMGVPVVALRAMGTEDILRGDRGGFMTNQSVPRFAAKVRKILDNPALRIKKSREAKETARMFSMKQMGKKLIKVYRQEIKEKKTRLGS